MQKVQARTALAVLMTAAALAGCGDDDDGGGGSGEGAAAKQEEVKTIAIVFPTLDAPFTQFVAAGAEAADAEIDDVKVEISTSNVLTDTQQQIQKIEDAMTRQPAGIAVFPSVAEPLVPVLERAGQQGAKLLVIDQDIPGLADKVSFVGTDNLLGGRQAGEYFVEQLGEEGGKVGIIGSSPGITSTDARAKGFKEAIAGSDIEVVSELVADCDRAKAQSVMEDMLSANPDLAGVFSVCDESALGAARAIKNAKKADQILHVGFDGAPEAVDLLAEDPGTIDADIAQNPYKMGEEGVKALAAAIRGESVEPVIDTGTDVVTPENAAEFQARADVLD